MRYILTHLLGIASAAVLLTAGAAGAGEILFPPDDYLTDANTIPVMLLVEAGDPMTLKVSNGEGTESSELTQGCNRVELSLETGVNVITWGDREMKVTFTGPDLGLPKGSERWMIHEAAEDCESCHVAGGGLDLNSEEPDLCFDCHDDPRQGDDGTLAVVHSPVEDGDCTSCHDPHASLRGDLLTAEVPTLCLDCHDDPNAPDGEPLAGPHEPVQSGGCLDCHLVHASANAALLGAAEPDFCFDCHDDPRQGDDGTLATLHSPVGDGDCTSCHQVHGSGAGALLSSAEEALCLECHDDLLENDQGEKYAFLHGPVGGGECLACHDAHASGNESLVLAGDPDLCLECHDDPTLGGNGSPLPVEHEVVEDGCLACHAPHGSSSEAFLSLPENELCLECHDDVSLDEEEYQYEVLHQPVGTGDCTACHGPHGASAESLLAGKGNDFCRNCHQEYHEGHRSADYEEGGMTSLPEDFPISQPGYELACRGCHQSHGSHDESLFVTDRSSLCAKCHRM